MSADEMKRLDDVRIITVSFSFTNPDVVPRSVVPRRSAETETVAVERQERGSGQLFIEAVEMIDCVQFPGDLALAGWALFDAFWQERKPRHRGGRPYSTVRFCFSPRVFAKPTKEILADVEQIGASMQRLLDEALWRVRAFRNPFYGPDGPIKGQAAISLNFEARCPHSAAPTQKPAGVLHISGGEIQVEMN